MDRESASAQPHELEYLARKHGTSVERVKEIMLKTGSRSREQIEAAILERFGRSARRPAKRVPTDIVK